MKIMFKLILQQIKSKNKRVSVYETLDKREILNHINGAIYIYRLSGKCYFTKTMILNYLNEQVGWDTQ